MWRTGSGWLVSSSDSYGSGWLWSSYGPVLVDVD